MKYNSADFICRQCAIGKGGDPTKLKKKARRVKSGTCGRCGTESTQVIEVVGFPKRFQDDLSHWPPDYRREFEADDWEAISLTPKTSILTYRGEEMHRLNSGRVGLGSHKLQAKVYNERKYEPKL